MWQYGSDETNDPPLDQDLVAPQKPIGGITQDHRAFIPNSAPRNWIDSHLVGNYLWIFDQNPTDAGYVKKR